MQDKEKVMALGWCKVNFTRFLMPYEIAKYVLGISFVVSEVILSNGMPVPKMRAPRVSTAWKNEIWYVWYNFMHLVCNILFSVKNGLICCLLPKIIY